MTEIETGGVGAARGDVGGRKEAWGRRVWVWGLLAGIVVAGGVLRFYALDRFSLWGDTGKTFLVCGAGSLRAMFHLLWMFTPDNPPLDLLVRHGVMKVMGRETYWLVFPSAVWSTLGLVSTFLLGRELLGERVGLIAAALLAVHPLDVAYAHEARNYAIQMALAPLATLMLVRALRTGWWRDWLGYGLLLAACFYAHLVTCGLAVAHGVFVAGYVLVSWLRPAMRAGLWRVIRGYAVAAVVAVGAFAPWALVYLRASGDPVHKYGAVGHYVILHKWPTVLGQFGYTRMISVGACAVFALALLGVVRALLTPGQRRALVLAVIVAVGYPVSYFATRQSFFHLRYVLYALPMYVVLVAAAIEWIAVGVGRAMVERAARGGVSERDASVVASWGVIVGAVVGMTILGWPMTRRVYKRGADYYGDYRSAARYVTEHYRDGDVVLNFNFYNPVFSSYSRLPVTGVLLWSFFREDEEAEVPANRWAPLHWRQIVLDRRPGGDNRGFDDFLASRGYRRAWLLWGKGVTATEPMAMVKRQLDRFGKQVESREFNGLRVFLYDLPEDAVYEPADFGGMTRVENLRGPEGPYPQFGNTIVRWGFAPATRVTFQDRGGGARELRLRVMLMPVPVRALRVKLNGTVVGTVPLGRQFEWEDAEVALPRSAMRAGEDVVEIEYVRPDGTTIEQGPGALFSKIQVVSSRAGATTGAATGR